LLFLWEALNLLPKECRKQEIYEKIMIPAINNHYNPNHTDDEIEALFASLIELADFKYDYFEMEDIEKLTSETDDPSELD